MLTRHLSPKFVNEPFVLVDIGALWGMHERWKALGASLKAFCFEADHAECDRLNAAAEPGVRYIPEVIAGKVGLATFHETKFTASSGLYPVNEKFFGRLLNRENAKILHARKVTTQTLDMARSEYGIQEMDFIKLDTEGAELEILQATDLGSTFGVYTEFRFHREINGTPAFHELDAYMRSQGFMLYDLEFSRQSRSGLPYRGPKLQYTNGERLYVHTESGQIMDGNALYLRDPMLFTMDASQIMKAACVFELFNLNDCAAELLLERGKEADIDVPYCLDLLAGGSYREYLEAY